MPSSGECSAGSKPEGTNSCSVSPVFSQRIVTVDFYTSYPLRDFDSTYSDFRRCDVSRVPVLRIFGSTPQGQKTCTHIHGVFPYISVLDDPSIEDFDRRFCIELDKALNDFLGSAVQNRPPNHNQHHIFNITKIRGKTYYGYRYDEEVFYRIYFYNPLVIKKAVDLMMSGRILGKIFQPYEAHIPYQLQFMIDFDLYGMSHIHYSKIKFRKNPTVSSKEGSGENRYMSLGGSGVSSGGVTTFWELSQLPSKHFSSVDKSTTCELEIDVLGTDIIVSLPSASSNTRSINPGIDAIWKDETERRRQNEEENWSQITIPTSQERPQHEKPASEQNYRTILNEKLNSFMSKDMDLKATSSLDNSFLSSQVQSFPVGTGERDIPSPSNYEAETVSEEDELLQLFYEMQEEKEAAECKPLQDTPILSNAPESDEHEAERSLEEEEVEDRQDFDWNQSFLSQTIINEFMSDDMEIAEDTIVSLNAPVSVQADTIFQGDGQGSNDDSEDSKIISAYDSDANNTPSVVRRGERRRTMTNKLREYLSGESAKKNTTPQELTENFTGRLSMSIRRKARRKAKSEGVFNTSQNRTVTSTEDNYETHSDPLPNLKSNVPTEDDCHPGFSCSDSPTNIAVQTSEISMAPANSVSKRCLPAAKLKLKSNIDKPPNIVVNQLNKKTSSRMSENHVKVDANLLPNDSPLRQDCGKRKKDVPTSEIVIPVPRISSEFVRRVHEVGLSRATEEEANSKLRNDSNTVLRLESISIKNDPKSPIFTEADHLSSDLINSKLLARVPTAATKHEEKVGPSKRAESNCDIFEQSTSNQAKEPTLSCDIVAIVSPEVTEILSNVEENMETKAESNNITDPNRESTEILHNSSSKVKRSFDLSLSYDVGAIGSPQTAKREANVDEKNSEMELSKVTDCNCPVVTLNEPNAVEKLDKSSHFSLSHDIPAVETCEIAVISKRASEENTDKESVSSINHNAESKLAVIEKNSPEATNILVPMEHTPSTPPSGTPLHSTPTISSNKRKMIRKGLKNLKSGPFNKLRKFSFFSPEAPVIEENFSSPCFTSRDTLSNGGSPFFEARRIASLSRARKRRLKKIALELQQDGTKNTFKLEYSPLIEPLPPKWAAYDLYLKNQLKDAEKSQTFKNSAEIQTKNTRIQYNENSSDEEPSDDVRKCFGESSSDEGEAGSSLGRFSDDDGRQSGSSLAIGSSQASQTTLNEAPFDKPSSKTIKEVRRKFCWEGSRVKKFMHSKEVNETLNVSNLRLTDRSELDGPSIGNQFGFAHDMSNLQDAKAISHHQYITVMSVEVLCQTRGELIPDPKVDALNAIFIYITNDVPDNFRKPRCLYKCLLVQSTHQRNFKEATCEYYANEKELIEAFIRTFHKWDPDILVGYEIEKMSWGYIIDRGLVHNIEMTQVLSRLLPKKKSALPFRQESWDGQMPGRIVLNLWRLMRHEITVTSYTYENVAYHVLHRKVCKFSFPMLAAMWSDARCRMKVMEHIKERVVGVTELMDKLDMINRTSELARLFGIQFYEVFSRGSQFRVESMMLRAAKRMNLIAPSPSISQRARMRAPEFLPLILEPQSKFYTNPVAVLDFQSLYPSMIIAYNYDYSTVLGRVDYLVENSVIELGCLETNTSPHILKELKDHIHISPAGVAFVTPSITRGILPQMLEQILDTRQMVKRAMKKWKNEGPTLQKILDSRQLGLKLIANVTYGYTSANFSGRMPCVEIADSVVSKGRETLQRAIDLVNNHKDRWGANVVYGDTDSMFLEFPGKTRQEAFKLAQDIADSVTNSNPKPVKLKLEKIYQPCILQTKKRYVGYSYETPEQETPVYDAKGIETVRRDGCPAVKKILEKCLHVLFTTKDPEKVKTYVQLQFKKIFTGRVSMKEYTFARAFRGREGYKPGACVPALEIAKRLTMKDPRAEPLTKQRVPYVVVYGKPTLPLIQLVRTPQEFVMDYTLRLNAHYYIEKVIIPALNRCLALAKIDVSKWYRDLPRKYLRNILDDTKQRQGTLDSFVHHANCFRCDQKTLQGVCSKCDSNAPTTASFLLQSISDCSRKLGVTREICETCSGYDDKCTNIDCPVFHKLLRYERDEYFNRQKLTKLQKIEF